MARTHQDLQDDIIRTFEGLADWMDKYEYLITLGKSLPPIDPALRTEANAISGCQSNVWISAELSDGHVYFHADSDALITRGLIGLLLHVLDHQPPDTVLHADLYFINRIGLQAHLSPSRANGLVSIITHMKRLAAAVRQS